MPLTIFLGRLFGIYCIIVALTMAAHPRSTVAAVKALVQNPSAVLSLGVVILAAGLALVLGHTVWSGGALSIIVTVLGWLTAIKGTVLLALPPQMLVRLMKVMRYEALFRVYMGVTLALGILLTYLSYGG